MRTNLANALMLGLLDKDCPRSSLELMMTDAKLIPGHGTIFQEVGDIKTIASFSQALFDPAVQAGSNYTRRQFLAHGALASALVSVPTPGSAEDWLVLRAAPQAFSLLPSAQPVASMWAYNGQYPGPAITLRQGDTLRVRLRNDLSQPTTVHWHGIRVPNAYDGVPGMTQNPVQPGQQFEYRFVVPDAGTYWYHPHVNTIEQIGRGLIGAVIVQERKPPEIDADWTWVLSDLRLDRNGQIVDNFRDLHDAAHAGRVGNVVFINGGLQQDFSSPPNARIRLRLLAATSARIFALQFGDSRAWLMALDGHPVPVQPLTEPLVLAPGQRADVLWEAPAEGQTARVRDVFYQGRGYELAALKASGAARVKVLAAPAPLPANPLPEVRSPTQPEVVINLQGGAMSREASREAIWLINGRAMKNEAMDHAHHPPLFTVKSGHSLDLVLNNRTMWYHPLHFHGVWLRQRLGDQWGPVRDTILLSPQESARVRLFADEPGHWMVHCHVLGHQANGMMGHFVVV